MAVDVTNPSPEYLAFWREYHLCTLTTPRPDGTPHVVPVGVTYDPEAGLARVITNKGSQKVANILAAGPAGCPGRGLPGRPRPLGDPGGPRDGTHGTGRDRRRGTPLRGTLRTHTGTQPGPRRHRDRPGPGARQGVSRTAGFPGLSGAAQRRHRVQVTMAPLCGECRATCNDGGSLRHCGGGGNSLWLEQLVVPPVEVDEDHVVPNRAANGLRGSTRLAEAPVGTYFVVFFTCDNDGVAEQSDHQRVATAGDGSDEIDEMPA